MSPEKIKNTLKTLLGELPLTAEMYWYLRQPGRPIEARFALDRLRENLPTWRAQAEASPWRGQSSLRPGSLDSGRRVLLFGTLRYWLEHVTLLGVTLAGLGHQVTLAYLPFSDWRKDLNQFDLRRQNLYAREILEMAAPCIKVVPFLQTGRRAELSSLPAMLEQAVQQVAYKDTQYTLQVEVVNIDSDLYRLRLQRNRLAAFAAYRWMNAFRPDIIILPNGAILEMGAIYQVAHCMQIPVVTYEFGEQRQRIWLAQNAEVMRQNTEALWQVRQGLPLAADQMAQIRQLFAARQRASLWENFARRWQGAPSEGGERVRTNLNLDARPIVLLATNVIGDSLTLGRQVFSDSMTEWLERTVQYFAQRLDVQFVIRIHPGELITKGPSVSDVVTRVAPELPENIRLIPADAQVNTYDLIEIADLGLVYTTTVGLEMAMSGVPVIAVGNTHYRGKGFTLDVTSWEGYFDLLGKVLVNPAQYSPTRQQVEQAWNYAYRFFFEYALPFPWHLVHLWSDLEEWPVERVLSPAGQDLFGKTFSYLVGEPIQWS